MPTPDYPVYFPFSTGNTIDADQVFTLLYDDVDVDQSLSVINGLLGPLLIDFNVGHEYTQRGSHVDAEGSAGTAALDYSHRHVFPGVFTADPDAFAPTTPEPGRPIPGANRTFYCKWAAAVRVKWTVYWTARNAENNDYKTRVYLVVDGAYEPAEMRQIGTTTYGSTTYEVRGYRRARIWTGHIWLSLAAGWHTVGAWILADSRTDTRDDPARVGHTRVHSCSIHLLQVKTGSAL